MHVQSAREEEAASGAKRPAEQGPKMHEAFVPCPSPASVFPFLADSGQSPPGPHLYLPVCKTPLGCRMDSLAPATSFCLTD